MRTLKKLAAALTLATVPFLAIAPAATAAPYGKSAPSGSTIQIVGGEQAPATPWAVQLIFKQSGGTYGCTGEQVNARWVLTARHCVDGTTAMNVYHSNSTTNRGTATVADSWSYGPAGDVALVHLSTAVNLSSYPALNLSYSPTTAGTATIMGYGLRANATPSTGLYQAQVQRNGRTRDAYRGIAQHVNGVTGASNHGDSGGPIIVNGAIVGVCSTGDSADPGSNINAGSNYAVLSQDASWIRTTISK